MLRSRSVVLAFVVIVAAASLLAACGSSKTSSSPSGASASALKEGSFNSANYKGRPLIVNFFASWCPACNKEAVDLVTFAKENADAVQFVGVAMSDEHDKVLDFIAKYAVEYPVFLGADSLGAEYGVGGYPTTIFFDADGTEKKRVVGAISAEELKASLSAIQ